MPINPPANSIRPKSRADWRKWLEENQARTEAAWFISYKEDSGKPFVSYDEAVDEALCFGWIDSKGNKLDAKSRKEYPCQPMASII